MITEAEKQIAQRSAFDAWYTRDETKMLISLLPAAETDTQRDCLKTLLRSAHDSGFLNGGGEAAADILMAMLNKMESEKRRP